MNDLNFFESYLDKRKFNIDEKLVYYLIISLLSIILIFYTVSKQIKISKTRKNIAQLKMVAEDKRITNKVEEIVELEEKVEELEVALNEIKLIDDSLDEISIIDNALLESITSRIPESIFLKSISIHTDNIEISGVSQDKQSVAELGKGLETIDGFKEVFISNLSKAEDIYYNFNLNINLKDVMVDEEENIEDPEIEEKAD